MAPRSPIKQESPSRSSAAAMAKERGLSKCRSHGKLMQWGVDQDQYLILAIDHVCKKSGIRIPWDAVGELFRRGNESPPTASAIEQHIGKLRKKRYNDGKPVPAPTRTRKRQVDLLGPQRGGNDARVSKSGHRHSGRVSSSRKRSPVGLAHNPDDASDPDDDYLLGGKKKAKPGNQSKKRGHNWGNNRIKKEDSDETITDEGPSTSDHTQSPTADNGEHEESDEYETAHEGSEASRLVKLPVQPEKLRQFAAWNGGVNNNTGYGNDMPTEHGDVMVMTESAPVVGQHQHQLSAVANVGNQDFTASNALGWGQAQENTFQFLQSLQHDDMPPSSAMFDNMPSSPMFPVSQNSGVGFGNGQIPQYASMMDISPAATYNGFGFDNHTNSGSSSFSSATPQTGYDASFGQHDDLWSGQTEFDTGFSFGGMIDGSDMHY